jgi:hypothetical protein
MMQRKSNGMIFAAMVLAATMGTGPDYLDRWDAYKPRNVTEDDIARIKRHSEERKAAAQAKRDRKAAKRKAQP